MWWMQQENKFEEIDYHLTNDLMLYVYVYKLEKLVENTYR